MLNHNNTLNQPLVQIQQSQNFLSNQQSEGKTQFISQQSINYKEEQFNIVQSQQSNQSQFPQDNDHDNTSSEQNSFYNYLMNNEIEKNSQEIQQLCLNQQSLQNYLSTSQKSNHSDHPSLQQSNQMAQQSSTNYEGQTSHQYSTSTHQQEFEAKNNVHVGIHGEEQHYQAEENGNFQKEESSDDKNQINLDQSDLQNYNFFQSFQSPYFNEILENDQNQYLSGEIEDEDQKYSFEEKRNGQEDVQVQTQQQPQQQLQQPEMFIFQAYQYNDPKQNSQNDHLQFEIQNTSQNFFKNDSEILKGFQYNGCHNDYKQYDQNNNQYQNFHSLTQTNNSSIQSSLLYNNQNEQQSQVNYEDQNMHQDSNSMQQQQPEVLEIQQMDIDDEEGQPYNEQLNYLFTRTIPATSTKEKKIIKYYQTFSCKECTKFYSRQSGFSNHVKDDHTSQNEQDLAMMKARGTGRPLENIPVRDIQKNDADYKYVENRNQLRQIISIHKKYKNKIIDFKNL